MNAKVTCKDLYDYLSEFLDGNLPEEQLRTMESHLEKCPCCKHYLENYQKAAKLGVSACGEFGDDSEVEVPEALVQAILSAKDA